MEKYKPLNFSRIKFIAEQKKISLRSIAIDIERTPTGFLQSINNESLRVGDLFKISEILETDVFKLLGIENIFYVEPDRQNPITLNSVEEAMRMNREVLAMSKEILKRI